MKRLFNPIRAFVYLRIVVASSCVLTAAALAFVATANSNSAAPSSGPISENYSKDTILWANENYDRCGDPDAVGDPTQAAAEDYAHRAYPRDERAHSARCN